MQLLFLIIGILLLLGCYIRSKNIFSPACIFCFMFILCAGFCYYASSMWRFRLSLKGFSILLAGMLAFVCSSLGVQSLFKKTNRDFLTSQENVNKAFVVSKSMIVPFLIVFFGISLLYYFLLCRVTGTSGLNVTAIFRYSKKVEMNSLGRVSLTILRAFSTGVCVILVNNYFAKAFKKNYGIALCLCVVTYAFLTLLSGERTSVVRIVGIVFISFGVFWKRRNPKKIFPVKYLAIGVLAFLGMLYGFSAIRFFVGRSSQLGLVDYLAFYFGSPLYNFDYGINHSYYLKINKGHTFLGLTNNLARLGIGKLTSVHRVNITNNVRNIFFGNTYTCMFDYYADFGMIGVIVLMAIFGMFITYLYCSAMYSSKNTIYKTAVYAFFGTAVIFAAFTEQLYGTYIAVSTIVALISIRLVLILLKSKITRKLKIKVGKLE